MRTRLLCLPVALLLLLAACGGDKDESSSGGDASEKKASEANALDFCSEYEETMPLLFLSGLVSSIAEMGDDELEAQGVAGFFPLIFAKPFQDFYAAAAAASSGAASKTFEELSDVYSRGPQYLRDAGFSDEDIKALEKIDITQTDDLEGELENLGADVDEQEVLDAARDLAQSVDGIIESADEDAMTAAMTELTNDCARAMTGGLEVCDLVTDDEVKELIGETGTPDGPKTGFGGGAGCIWTADDDGRVGVYVANAQYYRDTIEDYRDSSLTPESVAGLGDEAVIVTGFNSASAFSTSGLSLLILDGDRTVLLAADRDDDRVSEDALQEIAEKVLDRLG